MARVLLDTCIWYALCDIKDTSAPRETIDNIYERLAPHSIILPWPVAYETLWTGFVKKKLVLERFEQEAKKPRTILFDDTSYRDKAFELVFESSLRRNRPLSMVDCLIRLLIEDVNVKVDHFVTFNVGDFHDVCRKRRIELWSADNT
jgi:hypothetical protein